MPRTPRNPGSGKAPVNTPASGGPASGVGWGGPARGSGGDKPAQPRTAADSQRSAEIAADPVLMEAINRQKMAKEARAEAHLDFLDRAALNLPDETGQQLNYEPALRISAAVHFMNRALGTPRQTVAAQQLDKDGNPADPVAPVLSVTIARE